MSISRNRIGPSASTIYVANADGTNERALLPANQSVFEYHGHFSPNGKYITFTSEREDGNADLYRIVSSPKAESHLLGTSLHHLTFLECLDRSLY